MPEILHASYQSENTEYNTELQLAIPGHFASEAYQAMLPW